jgi:MoaA/NifB/PqqE/SkfB family radical SAM enzyme
MSGYVHRNLKSTEDISNLNTKDYKNLKEAFLVSINSNWHLRFSNKELEKLYADDLEKIKIFINNIQKEIQDSTFKP